MYQRKISSDHLTVTTITGFAPEIDGLAARNLSGHGFLRRAWFSAGGTRHARTLLLQATDGTPLAAIPTTAFGPPIAGARKVPGSYWPLRSPLIAPECTVFELAQALEHAASRSLGPVWRIGPARTDDPTIALITAAAQLANWTVLARPAGTSWVIDLETARNQGWPRPSTAKRLAKAERRLANLGAVSWRHVRGKDWNEDVLDQLAAVEAASWVARATDGSGAKFMAPHQRAIWRTALADPVLAEHLCATMLTIDGRAVAFSFDLDDGPVQYGIAGTYMTDFGKYEVGKLANYRAVSDSIADGQSVMDLGVGDSGYKEEMGAVAGYHMTDLLFVRSSAAALMLSRGWGEALVPDSLSSLALREVEGG
ncbi:MAG: GNAT family N-acetyltransferase [Sphingomonadales bacterium]|nr:MAG: GNAT family N-acetyltransferase [Sphingomonadales bacterium]